MSFAFTLASRWHAIHARPLSPSLLSHDIGHISVQVADLNRGAFGFVQLAKDVTTGEQVAIKFIERGDKVMQQGHVTHAR